ncbi:MAG: hypothetical protein HC889_14905, partial [Synechococcaceae cyanobacterium SM1_2_3]|nr:hypothetical protein [Synechococcaceae cyanobacterium SM1_2_3]
MKSTSSAAFAHDQPECSGVLLANLGTPDAPTPAAVRRYLAEFLWDSRVVEIPRLLWWLILHGVILRVRPAQSAHKYQTIWTAEGSPLLAISRRQTAAIAALMADRHGDEVIVDFCMRYGNPSTESRVRAMVEEAQERRAPVQRLVDTFARSYTPAVVLLALLVASLPPLLFGQPFWNPDPETFG